MEPYERYLRTLSRDELIEIILSDREERIPVTIFSTKLAPLESLVKYLKENRGMTNPVIAKRLSRSAKTIWASYKNVAKQKLDFSPSEFNIPLSFFSKKTSILETVVYYLKNNHDMTLHQIAVLLKRDDRTIWTTYDRAKKKNG